MWVELTRHFGNERERSSTGVQVFEGLERAGEEKFMKQDQVDRKEKRSTWYEHWGKFSDDELDIVEGRRELLVNKLQTKLGISREEADRRYQEFEQSGYLNLEPAAA